MATYAPYGYIKDPENKNHLLIDPEAAEVVRRIFQMAADGKDTKGIATLLNRDAVPTPMLYKRAAGYPRTCWQSISEDNFWTSAAIAKILRNERYIGTSVFGKRIRDKVGCIHTSKVKRADWIIVEDTHEGIVTRDEFNRAQVVMKAYVEHKEVEKHEKPLCGKVRCGICGYTMRYTDRKKKYLICHTPRYNSAYVCADRTPVSDILEALLEGLRVQALMAVELRRLWEEQHRGQAKDIAAAKKTLSTLREAHGQLCQQIKDMYESFALGEIGKPEYLSAKASAAQRRDAAAARIAELEASLDNSGTDGNLRNGFVSTFGKYMEVEEITGKITTEVLKEVRIYPGGQIEIVWNLQDELEKMLLDLQGE